MREDLISLLKDLKKNRDEICQSLTSVISKAVDNFNSDFSPRRFAKLERTEEPLPTAAKQLSSYRTRLGTMIEYAVSSKIDMVLRKEFGNKVSLTFSVAHEYPDFYLRGPNLEKILKIEMKTVDCESDEQAARFETPTAEVDPFADFVLFMAWEWKKEESTGQYNWEYPFIFSFCLVPSMEIVKERDRRLTAIGGKIERGVVLVPSTKQRGKFVKDPGNYGKFWRIVPKERWEDADLNPHIRRFLLFQKEIDERAPRKRMKKFDPKKTKLSVQSKL